MFSGKTMENRFYTPSGWVSPSALLFVPVSAAVVSSLLAPLYAVASFRSHWIILDFLLVVGYAFFAGLAAAIAVQHTHSTNPPVCSILALLGSLFGFWVSWSAWLNVFAIHYGYDSLIGFGKILDLYKSPDGWASLVFQPKEAMRFARMASEGGVWTLGWSSDTATGAVVWVAWSLELVVYGAVAMLVAWRAADEPYSEEARCYLPVAPEPAGAVAFPEDPAALQEVTRKIAEGDLGYLAQGPVVPAGQPGFVVAFRSADASPWGTVDVKAALLEGGKLKTANVANYVLATLPFIKSLRARLG
jgi:hypothetical protein